jgi:hypothetical protein
MKPDLEDLSLVGSRHFYAPTISGRIGGSKDVARFVDAPGSERLGPFNCSSAIDGPHSVQDLKNGLVEWPLAVCRLDQKSRIVSEIDHGLPESEMYMTWGSSESHLVMNVSGSFGRWQDYFFGSNYSTPDRDPLLQPALEFLASEDYYEEGEWLHIPSNDPMIRISLSICYTAFSAADLKIHASGHGNQTEPTLGWNAARKGAEYETLAIRKQLGAVEPSMAPEERGVLSLEPHDWTKPPPQGRPDLNAWLRASTYPRSADTYNSSALMCLSCVPASNHSSYFLAHQAQAAVFNDIVRDTRHPALALQAQYTTLFGMGYYDHAFQFDYNASANMASIEQALAPTGRTGFTVVVSILAVHLMTVVFVVFLFATHGGNGMVGNAWSVVSQLRTDDVEKWTSRANGLTDGEVKKEMERQGVANAWVGFRANGQEGQYFVEQETSTKASVPRDGSKPRAKERATW